MVVCGNGIASEKINQIKNRKGESLAELFRRIPEEQREEIVVVAIDMWEPYINGFIRKKVENT
jgi:transposase